MPPASAARASACSSTACSSSASTSAVSATPPAERISSATCSSLRPGAAGEEDPRSLAGEGPGDRAADRPARLRRSRHSCLEQHVAAGTASAAGVLYPLAAEYSSATFGQFTTFHQASM